MIIYNSKQVLAVENNAIAAGITQDRLMENAGSAVAKAICDRYDAQNLKVTVLCGKGNNGGDGFVVARKLLQAGAKVIVVLAEGEIKSDCAKSMFDYLSPLGIRVVQGDDISTVESAVKASNLVVDAVYGIGFKGELKPQIRILFSLIEKYNVETVAIDVPSGVDCDTASADTSAIKADLTVTFFQKKLCHVLYPAYKNCGRTILVDIGTPEDAYVESSVGMMSDDYYKRIMPKRAPDGHKGSFGTLGVICGSYGMIGAATIAAESAMKSGVGIVQMAVSRSMYPILAARLVEPVFKIYADNDAQGLNGLSADDVIADFERCNALLIGCGCGRTTDTFDLVKTVLTNTDKPIVIDADGLNVLADNDGLDLIRSKTVLTPHCAEMARLCNTDVSHIKSDKLYYGNKLACEHDCTVVLKDASTLVFSPDGRVIAFTGGNDGMATAGSGDMLAGIIASFTAQGVDTFDAAILGVHIHSKCGETTANKLSKRSMTTTDMIRCLSEVYRDFE